MEEFSTYFREVGDPRAGNARHDFLELIFVALAAVLCGAEDCTDMAEFARAKLGVLRQVVDLPHGAPSHDTFSRVFRLLDPERFEAAFARFTAAFAGALEGVVAIDGKALRGAYQRGCKATPLHLVNVWAAEKRLVIGQRQGSISFLQRRMSLGYPKAARFIDMMEQDRIIGPGQGAKPREILVGPEFLAKVGR